MPKLPTSDPTNSHPFITKLNICLSKNDAIKQTKRIKLQINGSPLLQANVAQYLGEFIDNQLNWKLHIE